MLRAMSKRLAPKQIPAAEAAKLVADGWELRPAGKGPDNAAADAIVKHFVFKDFHQAWAFMTQCVPFINATDHHPEWFNVYNRVNVRLTTHDCKGLSEKDFALAAEMQRVQKALEAPEKK
jgi:4a-hydroxytetrahydrobiopterin dehydratase